MFRAKRDNMDFVVGNFGSPSTEGALDHGNARPEKAEATGLLAGCNGQWFGVTAAKRRRAALPYIANAEAHASATEGRR